MLHSIVLYTLITIVIAPFVSGSYRYVGCYEQAFDENYFESSYMEPELCFRLCETPIIYIQRSICRCSWSGLMDYRRQRDTYCSTSCPKSGNRQVKTKNSCGGEESYSAYAENQFYTKHAHLFAYRIRFRLCVLWNTSAYYDTLQVKIDQSSGKLALNKLERCAAACLDQNKTTRSIGFNNDSNQCSCIMQQKLKMDFNVALNLTILSNNTCDRYCDNTFGDSNIEHKFKCGSKSDSQIWVIYDLTDLCPIDFTYVNELNECMYSYTSRWSSCPSSSKMYIYDGKIPWNAFIKIIEKLNLTKAAVVINFGADIVIDPAWKCLTGYSNGTENKLFYGISSRPIHLLDNGCLRLQKDSWYSSEVSSRLCITYSTTGISLSEDIELDFSSKSLINEMLYGCPMNWLDLNRRCYRISDTSKTIQEGRNTCIDVSQSGLSEKHQDITESISDDVYDDVVDEEEDYITKGRNDKMKDYISELYSGEVLQYSSRWQGRLGFFLLDTNLSSNQSRNEKNKNILSVRSNVITTRSSTNEFQMINSDNSTGKNDSCLVFTRLVIDVTESSILKSTPIDNCSKPRHILCTMQPIVNHSSFMGCFHKPLTLDLPAMISSHLTYKLCLAICQELETKLAVIQMNKCYCLNAGVTWLGEIKQKNSKHTKVDCGNPCPGNKHEQCGDENTIIVYNVIGSRSSSMFSYRTKLDKRNPDFSYDSCIYLHSVNPSTTYQFSFKHIRDIQPRRCLEICTKYYQNYALLNRNQCLCTNTQPKRKKASDSFTSQDLSCTRECPGNYFYTCGNASNSSLYSVYTMKLHCPANLNLDDDKKRCVYPSTSTKTYFFPDAESHCKSIGGMLAKVNDILEIEDVLPSARFEYNHYSFSHSFDEKKYFWIDRVSNFINTSKTSNRLVRRCSERLDYFDPHCIILHSERISIQNSMSSEQCLTESDECPAKSAIPVCVHQHLDSDSTAVLPIKDGSSSTTLVNTLIDYTCGDDKEYHLIDEYCYKVDLHETTWKNAKSKCEGDNATLFIPEKTTTIQMVKQLLLRQRVHTTSGLAHLGVVYNSQKRAVIQYNTKNKSAVGNLSDSHFLYQSCKETFLTVRRGRPSSSLRVSSIADKEESKSLNIGCGYVNFQSQRYPSISCDEVTCKQLATVICQKLPALQMETIMVKRSYIDEPIDDDLSVPSTDDQKAYRSIGRDYAPMFFIVAIALAFILLALVNILYKQYQMRRRNNRSHRERQNNHSIYSPVSTANEFDMN